MKISITSKKIKITDTLREKIESTFTNLNKFLSDDTEIYVTLNVTKRSQKIEATIYTKTGTILRAENTRDDLYVAIDEVYDKLYKQIRKLKTQLMKRNQSNESIRFKNLDEYIDLNYDYPVIKRFKKFDLDKPMTADEAILQMELLEHKFFVFRNSATEDINVIYKRHDGYGLIEQV